MKMVEERTDGERENTINDPLSRWMHRQQTELKRGCETDRDRGRGEERERKRENERERERERGVMCPSFGGEKSIAGPGEVRIATHIGHLRRK
jgi:hypothetical protein